MALWQDARQAWRSVRQKPGPALIAVVVLALGMGANTAVFSVLDAIILDPLSLRGLLQPGRVVALYERNPAMPAIIAERMGPALWNVREWKRQGRSFQQITVFRLGEQVVGIRKPGQRPERVQCGEIESNFFATLGLRPAFGRTFTGAEVRAGEQVAVLSGRLYRDRFGEDRNLVGKTIRLGGVDRAVVGVLPVHWTMPGIWNGTDHKDPQVWIPFDTAAASKPEELWNRTNFAYARLRPGVTVGQAQAEMRTLAGRLRQAEPNSNRGFGVNVVPLTQEDAGPKLRQGLFVLQAAVAFVLLVVCANLGNLLLARAVARRREIAIRKALGAGRGPILRLALGESLLLSLVGGALGVLLAYWGLDAISALAPRDIHGFHELRIDPLVLAFSFLLVLAIGTLAGLIPAWHSTRQDPGEELAKGGRTSASGPQWLRGGLVVGQVALALVLLVGAGLMIRSLWVLMNIDLGFRTDHLLTVNTSLENPDEARQKVFGRELLRRVERLPGVRSASLSDALPMEKVSASSYEIEGMPAGANFLVANTSHVTETFFATMGIPLREGRAFTREEVEAKEPRSVIVSEAFAKRNWPGRDALGRIVKLEDRRLEVVGVAGDTRQMGPDGELMPEIYLPGAGFAEPYLAVRTVGEPLALVPAVEKIVWSLDPQLAMQSRSMQRVLRNWPEERRFYMALLGGFAVLALAIASLGLYSVLAYLVSLRTRELGIRIALGADLRNVAGLVLRQGLRLAGAGIGIGLIGALLLTRLMRNLVFGVGTYDPLTFAAVAAALAAAALAASYLPARRAAKVNPIEVLRSE